MPSPSIVAAHPSSLGRVAAGTEAASRAVASASRCLARAIEGVAPADHRATAVIVALDEHARRSIRLGEHAASVGAALARAGGGASGARPDSGSAELGDDTVVAARLAAVLGLALVAGPGTAAPRRSVTAPDLVAAIVAGIDPAQLARVAQAYPWLVGPVDGMPVRARFAANRVLIAAAARAAEGQGDPARAADLRELLAAGRQILFVDPTGPGRVAEVLGDLDTAQHIAVVVPGMRNTLANFGQTLRKARALAAATGAGTAVVAWLGYDTPGTGEAPLDELALAGADDLRALLDGIGHTDGGDGRGGGRGRVRRPSVTVVAHSYGTVVTAEALRRGMDVDRVVVTGSPGMLAPSASQLDGDVAIWAARAPLDVISWSENFGRDPSDPRFGATRIATGDGVLGHAAYFRPGTESLANIARVVDGDLDAVTVLQPGSVERFQNVVDDVHAVVVEAPVDAVQRGLGTTGGAVAEYAGRVVDLGQRLTDPDLLGDVGADLGDLLRG